MRWIISLVILLTMTSFIVLALFILGAMQEDTKEIEKTDLPGVLAWERVWLSQKHAEEVQQWLQTFRYESDPDLYGRDDFWASCALTSRFGGDCEDYAICAAALLNQDIDQGYIIYVLNPEKKKAHAVFAYEIQGLWGINSNNQSEFRDPSFTSLQTALLDSVGKNYSEYIIYDYQGADLINSSEDLKQQMTKFKEKTLKEIS